MFHRFKRSFTGTGFKRTSFGVNRVPGPRNPSFFFFYPTVSRFRDQDRNWSVVNLVEMKPKVQREGNFLQIHYYCRIY